MADPVVSLTHQPGLPGAEGESPARTARNLHTQIEDHLKALPIKEDSLAAAVDRLVHLDCPLPLKFSKINATDLIKKNRNIKGADSLPTLISCFSLLEKYGRNLLKPSRPPLWKCINFMNSIFKTRVDIVKGARAVLQLMGYSEVVENGLRFPPEDESPDIDTVAAVTADLAIARRETELFHRSEHPHAYRFRDCLEGTMAVIQLPSRTQSGHTKNVFMRRSGRDSRPTYENCDIVGPPGGSLQQRILRSPGDDILREPSTPAYPPRSGPTTGSLHVGGGTRLGDLFRPPADTEQRSAPPLPNQRGLSPTRVDKSSGQQSAGQEDNVLCIMCGTAAASMQCDTCSGLRCRTCDENWHRHRSRRGHQSQTVQPKQLAPRPTASTVLCYLCGVKPASVTCLSCSSASCSGKYCGECDGIWHGHPDRQFHQREPLHASPAAALKPAPEGIVLSPVTALGQTKQETVKTSSSLKKKPVPAPRNLFHPKIDAGRSKSTSSHPKLAPKLDRRERSNSAPTEEGGPVSDDDAAATDVATITAQIERLLQEDIDMLRVIDTQQAAMSQCDKSSPAFQALQVEMQQYLLQHNLLLSRQRRLETRLAKLSTAAEPGVSPAETSRPESSRPSPKPLVELEPPLYDDIEIFHPLIEDRGAGPIAGGAPTAKPVADPQPSPRSVALPTRASPPLPSPRPRTPTALVPPGRNPQPKTQPEPFNWSTFFQQEEEQMLKDKQRAKEELERKRPPAPTTTTRPLSSPGPTSPVPRPKSPTPPPRHRKNQGASVPSVLNKLPQSLLEKRRLDEQRAQSMDFIKMLKSAEECGFHPDEVTTASHKLVEQGEGAMTELQWLDMFWDSHLQTVTAMATNLLAKEVGRSVGMVRREEARSALCRHCGDVHKAVEQCVSDIQTKVINLVNMGFNHLRVCEALSTRGGAPDNALIKLQQERAVPFRERIWEDDDAAVKEKCVVDLGVDRHPDTVERRLRMLLVEYELPSWGRSITAAQLIDTGRYQPGDAITAASECGDFERATQYLEKECQVCFSQFSMNKLSTLMHCQCMMCMECLHDHFKIVINSRNILNANCPACSLPDLRHSDMDNDETTDYFVYLDILLKGILDSESYQLFQTKLTDMNLMKETNFRWCAHCHNGFINDAPNRRKMRCNECNKLTCFQCKKSWMDQHENISCAEFQAWKEANDPNRAADGLAIHLKENGIDCPHCKMRYELAKGGCMHFRCVQCTYEFCSGCSSPFKKGVECDRFASCRNKGFHAHHPRDCLYYLKEQDTKELQTLLQKNKIDFNRGNPANQQRVCNVMEQKELPDGLKDDKCGRTPFQAGLCEIHYKEYLVSQINQNHIDPATEMNSDQLTTILLRNEIAVPAKGERESEAAYRTRLYQEVITYLQLEKKNPRDRAQTQ